jgi:aryl-alcohol dehydrogenase-like predicted oxidoreductase
MHHRPLGYGGLEVSALGPGCMGVRHKYGEPKDTPAVTTTIDVHGARGTGKEQST